MASDIERSTRELQDALERLDEMAAANIARSHEIKSRIQNLRTRLHAGEPLPAIVESETAPLIPGLITENIDALQEVGLLLRKTEAAGLRAHGYTMEHIAELFGVTRQRISAILKSDAHE